jgi:hypothetical protein
MPSEPFPAAAFVDHACELGQFLPDLSRRHLRTISLIHAPPPSKFTRGWRQWSKARDRVITEALAAHAGERLVMVRVNSGRHVPVVGPIYRSWQDASAFDAAAVAARLKGREMDDGLGKSERVYYSPSGPMSEFRPGEALTKVFFQCSFAETKALDRFTSIYLWLLENDPEVAKSYEYAVKACPGEFDNGDILDDYCEELGRHWFPDNAETTSVIRIDRGFGPIRIISFVRPIPAQALARIERRFSEAGQPFEIW